MGVFRGAAAIISLLLLLTGCSDDPEPALREELSQYTDPGDGCQQAVVAITYADASLKDAGQEQYQDFTDAVRSNIAGVAGTIALERYDFPSERTLRRAQRVAKLARETAARETKGAARIELLRRYRIAAERLVIECAREVPELRHAR